jgi:WD40 repeat protein
VGIWSLPSGNRLASLALESKSASMAFARDGRTLAVGGDDGTARIWRIEDEAELARIAIPAPSPGAEPPPITATALCGNGDYLLTTTAHSTRVWVVDSSHLIAQACRRLPDGLTAAEWRDYVGAESYRLTCGVYLRK